MPTPIEIDHILVCADASDASKQALKVAQAFATALKAKVRATHVFDVTRVDPELGHFLDEKEKDSLMEKVREYELGWADDVEDIEVELVEGQSIPTLLEMADETDLVVTGHSGRSAFSEMILGSVSKHLVAYSKAPVVVVQATHDADAVDLKSRAVVCAVDGSSASTRAAKFAAALAVAFQTRLEIITVADVSQIDVYDGFYMNEQQLTKMESRTHQRILDDVRPEVTAISNDYSERIVRGHAKQILIEESQRSDVGLIVVGRTGKGAFERMLQGSVSRSLTLHAACPAVIVP